MRPGILTSRGAIMSEPSLPEFLLQTGFNAHFNPAGNIVFTYEAFNYLLCFDARDPEYGNLVLPCIYTVSDPVLLPDVLAGLDMVNRMVKVVKGFTLRDKVSLSAEIWLTDQADWVHYLERALVNLDYARLQFGLHMEASMAVHAAIPINATIQ